MSKCLISCSSKSLNEVICIFLPFDLNNSFNAKEALFNVLIASFLSISSEKAKAFCPVSILFPINKTLEQKFLKAKFLSAVFTHLSRSPKDSSLFKSKNWETAIPAKKSFLKIPIK